MQDSDSPSFPQSSTSGDFGQGRSSAGATNQTKDKISEVAGQASSKVVSSLNSQKSKAAEGLGSVANALRQSGDQLRQQEQPGPVHQYISSAADQVERFSGYLRSTSVAQVVGDVEQFARRQPALFVGGALMLGLLGARFLKSSSRDSGPYAEAPQSQSGVPMSNYPDPRTSEGYWGEQGTGARDLAPPLSAGGSRGREVL